MVNYQYVLKSIASNHKRYAHDNFVIADDKLQTLADRAQKYLMQQKAPA